jgi:hypothetical protein
VAEASCLGQREGEQGLEGPTSKTAGGCAVVGDEVRVDRRVAEAVEAAGVDVSTSGEPARGDDDQVSAEKVTFTYTMIHTSG